MKTNWTAGIVAAMALSADKSWSAYTSDQLKDSLLKELTNSLPKMEVLTCQIESGIISQDPVVRAPKCRAGGAFRQLNCAILQRHLLGLEHQPRPAHRGGQSGGR